MKKTAVYSDLKYAIAVLLCVFFSMLLCVPDASADETVLTGKVHDAEGNAVEGAKIFVYDSPEVRRPADFISTRTARDGSYRMVVPPGKYWMIARLKKSDEYGPLFPGDRHSGEAVVLDLEPARTVTHDFTVTDLREAMKARKKEREVAVRISGRVLDEKGLPLPRGYVFANIKNRTSGMPDYLSAWADEQGRYTLYVPAGTYHLGAAAVFPPGQHYALSREMTVEGDLTAVDVVIAHGSTK